jgi:hypothetical protein
MKDFGEFCKSSTSAPAFKHAKVIPKVWKQQMATGSEG